MDGCWRSACFKGREAEGCYGHLPGPFDNVMFTIMFMMRLYGELKNDEKDVMDIFHVLLIMMFTMMFITTMQFYDDLQDV